MKSETKIIVFVPSVIKPQPPKKPRINKHLLEAMKLIIITLIIWLQPEATIAIALVKLLFIILDWLNQKDNS